MECCSPFSTNCAQHLPYSTLLFHTVYCCPMQHRSRAAKMELWKDDMDSALATLLNDLTMLQPPMWIYAARPTAAALEYTSKNKLGQVVQVNLWW